MTAALTIAGKCFVSEQDIRLSTEPWGKKRNTSHHIILQKIYYKLGGRARVLSVPGPLTPWIGESALTYTQEQTFCKTCLLDGINNELNGKNARCSLLTCFLVVQIVRIAVVKVPITIAPWVGTKRIVSVLTMSTVHYISEIKCDVPYRAL